MSPRPWYAGAPAKWAAAIVVVALVFTSVPVARSVYPQPRNLVSVADARHLAQLAAEKQLPLPAFHITSMAEDVPDAIRRYVGVWVSDTGWAYSDRQFMVIVTSVTKRGDVSGYLVNGPSMPYSRRQGPAFAMAFKGYINAGTLRYDGYVGMYLANLDREGGMDFKLIFQDGVITEAKLKPIWTLPKGGRTESAERAGGGARHSRGFSYPRSPPSRRRSRTARRGLRAARRAGVTSPCCRSRRAGARCGRRRGTRSGTAP